MKTILLACLSMSFTLAVYGQEIIVNSYNPPIPFLNEVTDNYEVLNSEPTGRPSCFYRQTNSVLYASVPDTGTIPNTCLLILQSTNEGMSWSIVNSIGPSAIVQKSKLTGRRNSDSIYCLYQIGNVVHVLNIVSLNTGIFTNYNVRDFDATLSSTNSLYLIVDVLGNNEVRIFGSVNGGQTWGGSIFLSSVAAFPSIYMSGSGDTCLINYYGVAIASDTISSAIRNVRYRENTPGFLLITGSFTTPITSGTPKDQFKAVKNENLAWLFYTTGNAGSRDMNCIVSIDGGVSYSAPVVIGAMPGRDEYWFDANYSNTGVDLVYYSDTLNSGTPTSISNSVYYCYALNTTPQAFTGFLRVNDHPNQWSERKYIPTVAEFFNTSNQSCAIWVGLNGTSRKLYFNKNDATTGTGYEASIIPERYILHQNYPNPFNPNTTIKYEIKKSSHIDLKIFNVIGKETGYLVNEMKSPGTYTVDFDASALPGGAYFIVLYADGVRVDTKKSLLVK